MTLAELADLLGLSKATVSYALRGNPMISAKTRELVQKRARELGYIPNPVASAFLQQIRSKRSNREHANLAFVLPSNTPRSYLINSVTEGALERATELGFSLDVIRCEKEHTNAQLSRLLIARGVLGIAIGPRLSFMGHLNLDWSRFAVAAFGYSMVRPALNRIVHNHLQGIRAAFRMCHRKGFRRIGLALSKYSDSRSNQLWSAGYLGIQQLLPKSERVPLFLTPTIACPFKEIRHWLFKERPEVLISHSKEPAPGFSELVKTLPWRLSTVLLDWKPNDNYAGIDQRFRLMGRLLVDALFSQIACNTRGVPEIPIVSMVDGVWKDHPSLIRS